MVKINEIAAQNPWWKYGIEFARYDKHLKEAEPVFFKRQQISFEKGKIYIIRGPRQVGKTTYLKRSIKELIEKGIPTTHVLYLSIDTFTSRRELKNALAYFLESTREAPLFYIFLDEITSLEDWNLEFKNLADQGTIERGVIVATGSSSVKLKEKAELLPGRGLEGNEYLIKPLCFREFLLQSIDHLSQFSPEDEFKVALKQMKKRLISSRIYFPCTCDEMWENVQRLLPFKNEISYLFRLYLVTGGFPGVINHYFLNRYTHRKDVKDLIEPSVSEIFVRDVLGDMARLQKQESITRQLFKAIIERYGSRYSFTAISKNIERTHITAIDYLEHLEDSFICFVLYAYDFNKKTPKWKGNKKVYFFDPFILHSIKSYLIGNDIWATITETLQDEEFQGKLIEGMVISHLIMQREIPFLKAPQTFVWFYYDKSGREIDVVFKENGGYWALEVKYRRSIEYRKLKIAIFDKYIVLSRDEVAKADNIIVIPVDIFLSLLSTSERNL